MPKWARDEDHGRSLLSGVCMTSRLASAIPATPDGNKIMRMARMVRLLSSDIRNWRGQFFMSPDNCQHVDVEPHSEDLYVRSRGEWSSKPRTALCTQRHASRRWSMGHPQPAREQRRHLGCFREWVPLSELISREHPLPRLQKTVKPPRVVFTLALVRHGSQDFCSALLAAVIHVNELAAREGNALAHFHWRLAPWALRQRHFQPGLGFILRYLHCDRAWWAE
jgi:hypothetical protein